MTVEPQVDRGIEFKRGGIMSPMRTACWIAAGLVSLSIAQAQYSTGFENPPFASGALNGQDSWTSGGSVSVLTASEIETALSTSGLSIDSPVRSGDQALLVSGSGGGVTSRRAISGLESLTSVLLDVWVCPLGPREDVGATSLGNIFLVVEDDSNATAGRAAALRFGYYDNGSGTVAPHVDVATSGTGIWQDTGVSWEVGAWYNIRMNVDFAWQTYGVSLDGAPVAAEIPFYSGNVVDHFGAVRIYRGSNQAGMLVDDLVVIPEPGAMSLLLLGGCALMWRRKVSAA
ncbi:MAG TPA: PEP-CTERM sorting domain-containing protein [Verrucomicrobiota bacterium]|nr:PEP-CTERM sorting domain-containing protein [Verrucomicrobiota bacterium]